MKVTLCSTTGEADVSSSAAFCALRSVRLRKGMAASLMSRMIRIGRGSEHDVKLREGDETKALLRPVVWSRDLSARAAHGQPRVSMPGCRNTSGQRLSVYEVDHVRSGWCRGDRSSEDLFRYGARITSCILSYFESCKASDRVRKQSYDQGAAPDLLGRSALASNREAESAPRLPTV